MSQASTLDTAHAPRNQMGLAARLARGALTVGRAFADAVLPQVCCGCNAWLVNQPDPLCTTCRDRIARLRRVAYCTQCGRTLAPAALRADECGLCTGETTWNVARLVRVGPYRAPLDHLVRGTKYGGRDDHVELIAQWLGEALQASEWLGEIDLLVPIPMHALRRWQRPTNHVYELAARLHAWTNIPLETRAVVRSVYRPSQTGLASRNARLVNVADNFAVVAPGRLNGRVVCLVDNMLTSGATLHEVSKAVRKAGARKVYAAVVARSVLAADFQADPEAVEGQGLRDEGSGIGV